MRPFDININFRIIVALIDTKAWRRDVSDGQGRLWQSEVG